MSQAAQRETVRGTWIAVASFALWGVMPLYWHALNAVPSLQIVLHRIVWSALFVGAFLFWRDGRGWLRALLAQPRTRGTLALSGTLIAFIVVCLGVLILRYTRPDLERPFRVPAIWATSLLGVAFCGIMAGFLPRDTWLRLLIWTAIGVAIYFLYGYRKSALNTRQQTD